MILSFRTDWSGQIVQTQIRLLLEEHSDQGLHYLQYLMHLVKPLFFRVLGWFQQLFRVSEYLGLLQYWMEQVRCEFDVNSMFNMVFLVSFGHVFTQKRQK